MIWAEILVLLACIAVGARLGGIGIGTTAGIGLFIFVFFFGLPPGGPPAAVIGMIIAVITGLAGCLGRFPQLDRSRGLSVALAVASAPANVETEGARRSAKRRVVRRDLRQWSHAVTPDQRGRQVDGVDRADRHRHRIARTAQHWRT
jgi:Anaerobic c4-dicarboxylate membrane transporter